MLGFYPMKSIDVQPFFVEKPWGGNFISEVFKLPIQRMIGEALLVSTLSSQENNVGDEKLSKVLGFQLPYVIKLIDANENLSVQVHPNDHFAKLLENSAGKTECWLIADAKEGAGVYFGLKDEVSLEQFFNRVTNHEDVSSLLNFIPVKKNDFIVVPSGTIHAIGAGVRLIEFQQSSGITYRIWDWGREGRDLHIEKSFQVSNPEQSKPEVLNYLDLQSDSLFFKHEDFELTKVNQQYIKCSSPKSRISILFDVINFKFSLNNGC